MKRAATRPRVAVVGAGRLARALVPRLRAAGYPIVAVAARSLSSARTLARRVGSSATTDPRRAVAEAELILLAVPDREIERVAAQVAEGSETLRGRIALHHAGSLGLEPLRSLAKRGAAVGVLHPFQVLSDPDVAASVLPGSFARIEGDRRALPAAARLAKDLGLVAFRPSRSLGGKQRAAYHAAASLVANDLVALLSLASGVLARQGIDPSQSLPALVALARGALAHAERGGLAAALTGPISRGDAATVEAQLASLRDLGGEAAEAHRILGRELLALARADGRLPRANAAALERLLAVRSSRSRGKRR